MRTTLLPSLGVACAAATVAVMITPPAGASDRPSAVRGSTAEASAPSTRTIPLEPLTPAQKSDRALPEAQAHAARGVSAREVEPFSLLGITWDDPSAELHGQVQVRTRDAERGRWSQWQDLKVDDDHAPDPGSDEARGRKMRGSTAPLWVGRSDAVEVRVVPAASGDRSAGGAQKTAKLPDGLRLDMVDPGFGPAGVEREGGADQGEQAEAEERTSVSEGNSGDGADRAVAGAGAAKEEGSAAGAPEAGPPYIGPRPRIVSRAGWGADESLREREFLYTGPLKVAFVHHSDSGNNYTCSQAPSVIRAIYQYHVKSRGWRDIGYNFLVDKCGTIYEGRAGGVTKAVMGAHTYGFNSNSMGVAALGSYNEVKPSSATVNSIAKLTAWKLGLFGVNPKAKVTMVSGGGKFPKGTKVKLNTISGHRNTYNTDCPGDQLYSRLGATRTSAHNLQGRS